jgi:glycosyltransferase involved in cell wall biosynthesis
VLISHPVHQHAYETAVAAQQLGLLGAFVTGIYFTGRGATSPRLLGALPPALRRKVPRELARRWHPELDAALVHTISPYHVLATSVRRLSEHAPPLRHLRLDGWADLRFDEAVGRRLKGLPGLRLVHGFEGSALETFRTARRLGLTTVLDVASAHEHYRAVVDESTPRTSLSRIRMERELSDFIFAPSDYVIDCLVENGVAAEKIVKIPYGVDEARFAPRPRPTGTSSPFRVLYVGSIGLRKGVRYLLEAWRALGLANAELVLVGQPDRAGREILRDFRGQYYWPGEVPKYSVDQWFRKSDVFVLPSLAEGSALVTHEALASGVPVVTTPNSGSVVRDGVDGFVVPPRDVRAIATSIEYLHGNPEAARAMGRHGRDLIMSTYTWKHYRMRVATAYESILSEGEPASEWPERITQSPPRDGESLQEVQAG